MRPGAPLTPWMVAALRTALCHNVYASWSRCSCAYGATGQNQLRCLSPKGRTGELKLSRTSGTTSATRGPEYSFVDWKLMSIGVGDWYARRITSTSLVTVPSRQALNSQSSAAAVPEEDVQSQCMSLRKMSNCSHS